jgi:hypothetical protein
MGLDPHPELPEDGSRPGSEQDPGRPHENQSVTSAPFADGQRFDAEKAGLSLAAALAGTFDGLGSLDDDALAGFLGGCQKIAASSAGMLLAGIAEFAGRRPDDGTPGRAALYAAAVKKARKALAAGEPADPPGCDEFTADELMPVLRLSKGGAHRQVGLALALRYRLRGTWTALLDGRIDVIRARIIAEGTADLSPADAATVEAIVLDRAGRQTYVALGLAVGKAVVQADPAGAMKRRKRGEKQARVEQWREYDGTGALAGRNLPPGDTLAASQALTSRAVELRAAGLDGPLDYLRAVALIDRITWRDSRPSAGERGPEASADEDWDNRDDWPVMDAWLLDQQGSGKRIAARLNLTISVETLLGLGDAPGDPGPFGPLDPAAARELACTAAAHPATRWCLTVTGHHAGAHRQDLLRSSRRRIRLHSQPQAPTQDPRAQPDLFLLGLPQARGPVRRRPHYRLAIRGPDLRMQPRPAVPPAPSHETTPRLAA